MFWLIHYSHYDSVADPAVGWGEKYEIYAAAFGSHLFYELSLQGQGGMDLAPP